MMPLNLETLTGRLLASGRHFHILNNISVNIPGTHISPEVFRRVKLYVLADQTFHLPDGCQNFTLSHLLRRCHSRCRHRRRSRLFQNLPQDYLETPGFLQSSPQPHVSILGLQWSPVLDSFFYELKLPQQSAQKWQILSSVLSLRFFIPAVFLLPSLCGLNLLCKYYGPQDGNRMILSLKNLPIHGKTALRSIKEINIPRSLEWLRCCSVFSDSAFPWRQHMSYHI
ncbi:hypothetical protein J6590_029830 [Homalodisca vitripennis]|nr:hypothetical protein J6590_029830 [Homalodisca vitripennis]